MLIPLGFWAASGAGGGSSAGAFELISTVTGTGSSGVITFSSIPSTYKHLQVRAVWTSTTALSGYTAMMRLNADSGSNYARHFLMGDGSAVNANNSISNSEGPIIGDTSGTTNCFTASIIDILDYTSTTKNKTVKTLTGRHGASNKISLESGVRFSTTAVTSLDIHTNANFNFTTSSRFSLYGLKG